MALDPLVGTVVRALPTTPGASQNLTGQFVVGQTLKGLVLRALPEGKTLVNFGGVHVLLELDQPLIRGQAFLATVEQSSPSLILKVAANASLHATDTARLAGQQNLLSFQSATDRSAPGTFGTAQLKSYLLARHPFGDMATALQQHLASASVAQTVEPTLLQRLQTTLNALLPPQTLLLDAAQLQAQVEQSGLNYEAKVHHALMGVSSPLEQAALADDLKGQLLELQHQLTQPDTTATHSPATDRSDLQQAVHQALRNIEFHQLANVFALQEQQSLLLQFVHPMFGDSHTAKLYVRQDAQEQTGSQPGGHDYTLVFLLDLTAVGPVRIDASVRGNAVSATIRTPHDRVAQFIAPRLASLTASLQHLGFTSDLQCRVEAQVPMDIDDSLTRVLVRDTSRLVDVTA